MLTGMPSCTVSSCNCERRRCCRVPCHMPIAPGSPLVPWPRCLAAAATLPPFDPLGNEGYPDFLQGLFVSDKGYENSTFLSTLVRLHCTAPLPGPTTCPPAACPAACKSASQG